MRLTESEIGNVIRQRSVAEVLVSHVHVHVLLSFGCLEERHEACSERRHEDGQHAEVENVPEVHDVLPGPVAPNLFTF